MFESWLGALAGLHITHADRSRVVRVDLRELKPYPEISFWIPEALDTVDNHVLSNFYIATTALTFFPGAKLARVWVAGAWAGYCTHEALELVRINGERPFDPHASVLWDRGLRVGIPPLLTPQTLLRSLEVVIDREEAVKLCKELSPEFY